MICRISADAREDLLEVWEYSRTRWGTERADLYLDQLLLRFAWLESHRGLWHDRHELGTGVYSYPEQSHVTLFRAFSGGIAILRILHSKMDPASLAS